MIIDEETSMTPIEIRSGKTINTNYFNNLLYWLRLRKESKSFVLYPGEREEKRSSGINVKNWLDA